MINGSIIHPDILLALARAGHTSKVLVADGHFPSTTFLGPKVPKVYLNLAPGLLTVTQVLEVLVEQVAIESAAAAVFEDGSLPEIWTDYRRLLGPSVQVEAVKGSQIRTAFHDDDVALAIMTGDTRPASCIVLSLGLRQTA
ncbi:RbsD/FucU domain-containing protein [Isoptericola sp. b441]|uniref:RbsD/FucU domain-containing protein n=1 Tax=Actinotalea lenta TaxID=3064654 RepID=A0ABT9DB29_9CELL|nr:MULTISPECIES: RbsD/FucU domain-containing protein [unclassified Isoptericola]MDO8106152.1 RbsD/FucU domain-containing protein [Isoptericola sp. b441]MDO8122129.1 RbsD/FucU domain-containing protein [Isoptericola sp. b490]